MQSVTNPATPVKREEAWAQARFILQLDDPQMNAFAENVFKAGWDAAIASQAELVAARLLAVKAANGLDDGWNTTLYVAGCAVRLGQWPRAKVEAVGAALHIQPDWARTIDEVRDYQEARKR